MAVTVQTNMGGTDSPEEPEHQYHEHEQVSGTLVFRFPY